MSISLAEKKMIDAKRLLDGKIQDPSTDYEYGWNAALQAAYDVEAEGKTTEDDC